MATSYANTGGSGNRTSIITVTSAGGVFAGTHSALVNGNTSDSGSAEYLGVAVSGAYIRFDFGSGASKIIDEVKHYQQDANTHGTWKWQGSNDASGWTDIGSSFTLGGTTTQTITAMSGNTTGYRYYQVLGVSGTASNNPWIWEYEFKIDDFVGGGTTPKGPLSNPFMGPFGGPIG